jgi:tetratricopeptide (TPR) repeat protein
VNFASKLRALADQAHVGSKPLAALFSLWGKLQKEGVVETGLPAAALDVAPILGEVVTFLTSKDRSWMKGSEPEGYLEIVFSAICHDAYLKIVRARAQAEDAENVGFVGDWRTALALGFRAVAEQELDVAKDGPAKAAEPVFAALKADLCIHPACRGVEPETWEEINRRAHRELQQRLANLDDTAVRLRAYFEVGDYNRSARIAEGWPERSALDIAESPEPGRELEPLPPVGSPVLTTLPDFAKGADVSHMRMILQAIHPAYALRLDALVASAAAETGATRDWIEEFFADARSKHESRYYAEARSRWLALKERLQGTPDATRADYLARVTANLGVCDWHEGRTEEAQAWFAEARRLAPHHPKMRYFGALADHLAGRDEPALATLDELVETDFTEPQLRFLRAHILGKLQGHAAAVVFLEQGPLDSAEAYAAMCHHLNEAGRFGDAQRIAEEGISRYPDNHALHHSLAFSLTHDILQRKAAEHDHLYVRNEAEEARVARAVEHAQKALDLARALSDRSVIRDYYANVAGYLRLAAQDRKALALLPEAEKQDAVSLHLLVNLFISAAHAGDDTRLDELLVRLKEREDGVEHHRRCLLVAMLKKDPALFAQVWADSEAAAKQDLTLSLLRIEACLSLNDKVAATAAIREHRLHHAKDRSVAFVEAELAQGEGRTEDALALCREAEGFSEIFHRAIDLRGLILFRAERWEAALETWKRPGLDPIRSPRALFIGRCLYGLERYEACLELATQADALEQDDKESLGFLELRMAALTCLGRFQAALPLLEELCRCMDRPGLWLKRHEVLLRLGRTAEAAAVILEAGQRHRADADIQVALSAHHAREGDARLAFQAARLAHALEPESEEARHAIGRIAPLNLVRPALKAEEEAEVQRHAEAIGLLRPIFLPMKNGVPDVPAFLDQLARATKGRAAARQTLAPGGRAALFRNIGQALTIGSHLLGVGVPALWTSLKHSRHHLICAARGKAELLRQDEREAFAALGGEIVLDATALLTADLLGMWDVLPRLFSVIHVPEETADALFADMMSARQVLPLFPLASGLPQLEGEEPPSRSMLEELIRRLETICAHVSRAPFRRTPITATTRERWARNRRLNRVPAAVVTSLMLSDQEARPLWSDDLFFTATARAHLRRSAFPSQALLRAAARASHISLESEAELGVELAAHGYHFTSLDRAALRREINRWSGAPDRRHLRILQSMIDTSFESTKASVVLGLACAQGAFCATGHSEAWRTLAGNILRQWTPRRDTYRGFCEGAARALRHSPPTFFGLIKSVGPHLAPASLEVFFEEALEVARRRSRQGKNRPWTAAMALYDW